MESPLDSIKKNTKIDAVLFDMDGTVLDSHPSWDNVFDELLVEYRGHPQTPEESYNQLKWSMDECHEYLLPDMPKEDYFSKMDMLFERHAHLATVLPGAMEMISEAHRLSSGRIALVTNAPFFAVKHLLANIPAFREAFGDNVFCAYDKLPSVDDPILRALADDECFKEATGPAGDHKVPSKPKPLMLRLAAAKLGVSSANCIMIGDGINDIRSGNRCGATTIGINWPMPLPGGKKGEMMEAKLMEEADFNTRCVKEVTSILSQYVDYNENKE